MYRSFSLGQRGPTASAITKIGLLWNRTRTPAGNTIVWHNGGTAGYRTFAGWNANTGEGVVIIPNTSNSVDEIAFHLDLDASVPLPPAPKVRKEVALSPEQLDRYVGVYDSTPAFAILVTRAGNSLWIQGTGQPKFQVYAESDGEFFLKAVDAQISFTRDAGGSCGGGRGSPSTRTAPTSWRGNGSGRREMVMEGGNGRGMLGRWIAPETLCRGIDRVAHYPRRASFLPTVLRVNGFRCFVFGNERGDPAHIQVQRGDCYAKFWLGPVVLDAWSGFRSG